MTDYPIFKLSPLVQMYFFMLYQDSLRIIDQGYDDFVAAYYLFPQSIGAGLNQLLQMRKIVPDNLLEMWGALGG